MDLLAQMAMFVRVVEGRSLSAAARSQRLSLPAVSRQLRALEEDLGKTLIVRSTRRLHLTEAGQRWYEHCVRVLRDVEEARASVMSPDTVRGVLVVSASVTYGIARIVPKLRKLAERHPHLVVDLRLEDHLVDLVGEGIDVAVRAGSPPPDSTQLVAHPLEVISRVLVASPRYLRKKPAVRAPRDLPRRDCLVQVTPAGVVVKWRLCRGDEHEIVDVPSRFRSSAPIVLRDLARDDAGIGYLPDWLVAEDVASGRLRRVLPEWASPPITAWAIHRAELRGSQRIKALLELLGEGRAARRA